MTSYSRISRITHITATAVCLLCCIPQQGICASVPVEQLAKSLVSFDENSFLGKLPALAIGIPATNPFQDLTDTINESQNPLETTKQFILQFVNQMNLKNDTFLTFEEAVQALRLNTDLVQPEYRESLLLGIQAIEMGAYGMSNLNLDSYGAMDVVCPVAALYWPWEWNWFGLNKKEKENVTHQSHEQTAIPPKYLVFGLIIAAIVVVAVLNPGALTLASKAMIEAAALVL